MTTPEAQYRVGDYLVVYSGDNEGCCFTVTAVAWHEAEWVGQHRVEAGWFYDGAYGWKPEKMICTEAHARVFP